MRKYVDVVRVANPQPRRELANGVGGESIFMDGMKREIWSDVGAIYVSR